MKLPSFVLLMILCFSLHAQEADYQYDFSKVRVEEVDQEKLEQSIDSIWNAVLSDSLMQLYSYVQAHKPTSGYFSFDIGYESSTSSLTHLNRELQALGFGEITETFGSVPWGFSLKRNRWLFTYLFAPGIKNSTSNDDYRIEVEGMSLDIAAGFAALDLKRLQLYPQLRLGLQDFEINAMRRAARHDITDVNELISNPAETTIERSSLTLTYGLEADYHLLYSENSGGIILAFKYGVTSDLARGKWKIDNETAAFSSSDRIRESSFTLLLRFYMKN